MLDKNEALKLIQLALVNYNKEILTKIYASKKNSLEKDNYIEYTPLTNYSPATKKYVDDSAEVVVGSSLDIKDNTKIFVDIDSNPINILNTSDYQTRNDLNLKTSSKNIVAAINDINEQFNTVANKDDVAKISSGTPLFASSTTEMIDITRNYVNTTDGYLYAYINDMWTNTNVLYQSVGVADKSITLNKLNSKISSKFKEEYSELSISYVTEKYIKRQDASIVETTGYTKYSYCEIYVNQGDKFRISGVSYYDMVVAIIVDRDNKVIQTYPNYSTSGEEVLLNQDILITEKAYKMYVNNYNGRTVIEKVTSYKTNELNFDDDKFTDYYKEIKTNFQNGYYLSANGEQIFSDNSGLYKYSPKKIKVMEGEEYKFDGNSKYGAFTVICVDVKGKTVASFPSEHVPTNANYYVKDYKFKVPANAVYILLNASNNIETKLFKLDGRTLKDIDKFEDKNIVFDGDSITYGAGVSDHTNGILPNKNMGWVYAFQQKHLKAKCYGYAQSGWRIARKSSDSTSLLQHIASYPNQVDYFVLSGGYNDQAQSIPLGTISDKYYNCEFDEYTFTGALESYFRQLVQNYPKAKKLYILTPKKVYSDSSKTQRFNNYWQRIREVCEKWAIPYLDLSKVGGIVGTDSNEIVDGVNVDDLMFADTLVTGHGDYVHPNQNFYDYHLNDKVDNAINSL